MGCSPSLAEQLCLAAGVEPRALTAQLSDGQWEALHGQWQGWVQRVEGGGFAPSLDPRGSRWGGWPPVGTAAHSRPVRVWSEP